MTAVESKFIPKSKRTYYLVRTRSIFACFLHWTLFASIICLVITGLYIGYPEYLIAKGEAVSEYLMGYVRLIHFFAATGLVLTLVLRLYISFTPHHRRDIMDILPLPGNIIGALKLSWYYLTFRGDHYIYKYVNPLGGLGVFTMIVCCIAEVFTGFLLFSISAGGTTWEPFLPVTERFIIMMGGLQFVRLIHHIVLYVLMAVVIIHVYMQLWKNSVFTEADMASIFSGYKMFPGEIVDKFDNGEIAYKVKIHK